MLNDYAPDQVSAFWNSITALATVATAVVAVVTLLALKRDSRDRTRPIISAEFRHVVLVKGRFQFVVRNIGRSLARDVTLTFDPPLPG